MFVRTSYIFYIKKLTLLLFTAKKWCAISSSSLPDNLELEDTNDNASKKGKNYLNSLLRSDHVPDTSICIAEKNRGTLGNPTAVDTDGLLVDVDVQALDVNIPSNREDKRQDVDQFFDTAVIKDVKGKSKKYCTCKICP
jgi:hypothetical protein